MNQEAIDPQILKNANKLYDNLLKILREEHFYVPIDLDYIFKKLQIEVITNNPFETPISVWLDGKPTIFFDPSQVLDINRRMILGHELYHLIEPKIIDNITSGIITPSSGIFDKSVNIFLLFI